MMPKNLLILGASGGTGQQLVAQALGGGHHVTAFVRKPSGIRNEHPHLRLVTGSLPEHSESLSAAIRGQDVVVSALGRGRSFKSERLLQQSIPLILAAMETSGVDRFILTSAIGVGSALHDAPLFSKLFARTLLREIYADKAIGEDLVRRTNLDWTIVQPAQLTDGPLTGKYQTGERLKHRGMPQISRADVAHFILSLLDSGQSSRKIVRIGYT